MARLNAQRLIFGLYLLVLIVLGEIILSHFNLPAWPAFMVMIFFSSNTWMPRRPIIS